MRIAIIGSGISGLGAAYLLSRVHEVEIFESENRACGHPRTLRRKGVALDTGFLVHNQRNYPLLTRLVQKLGVPHVAVRDVASLTAADVQALNVRWTPQLPIVADQDNGNSP